MHKISRKCLIIKTLDGRKTRVLKKGHARVETCVLKTRSVSKKCRRLLWALADSMSAHFKNARVEKMPLNIRTQWNGGTACVSECVLKTLACRGLRVGPSKFKTRSCNARSDLKIKSVRCSGFKATVSKFDMQNTLFEGLIFLLACSLYFIRGRFWAISTESQRNRPSRRQTKCIEHASKKIRSSKRLELYIFLNCHACTGVVSVICQCLQGRQQKSHINSIFCGPKWRM